MQTSEHRAQLVPHQEDLPDHRLDEQVRLEQYQHEDQIHSEKALTLAEGKDSATEAADVIFGYHKKHYRKVGAWLARRIRHKKLSRQG